MELPTDGARIAIEGAFDVHDQIHVGAQIDIHVEIWPALEPHFPFEESEFGKGQGAPVEVRVELIGDNDILRRRRRILPVPEVDAIINCPLRGNEASELHLGSFCRIKAARTIFVFWRKGRNACDLQRGVPSIFLFAKIMPAHSLEAKDIDVDIILHIPGDGP